MVAYGIGAHVVQPHLGFRLLGVRLEEYGLPMPAFRTGVVLGSGHRKNEFISTPNGINSILFLYPEFFVSDQDRDKKNL